MLTTNGLKDGVLVVDKLTGGYQRSQAVIRDVTLLVGKGEFAAVLGANGAGKSTLLRALAGMLAHVTGTVKINGKDVSNSGVQRRVARGMTLVPQGFALFPGLTVEENLRAGAWRERKAIEEERRKEIYALMPRLAERRRQRADALSGGERGMLAVARGLMAAPDLLMLDEPSLGVAPLARRAILEALRERCGAVGLSVIVAEQDVASVLGVADTAYVLVNGRVAFSGQPVALSQEVLSDLFLGGAAYELAANEQADDGSGVDGGDQ